MATTIPATAGTTPATSTATTNFQVSWATYTDYTAGDFKRIFDDAVAPDKSDLRAFFFGHTVNDDGYALAAKSGKVIEDHKFQLLPGYQYDLWPHTLGVHKVTGKQIPRADYDRLSPNEQQNYDILGYLDLVDKNGALLRRVLRNDRDFVTELILNDACTGDPVSYRYITECGTAHGPFPVGCFYNPHDLYNNGLFAHALLNLPKGGSTIPNLLINHIRSGFVGSIGQLYLAWLQAIGTSAETEHVRALLKGPDIYQLNVIRLAVDHSLVDEYLTDDDIEHYLGINGNKLCGLTISPDYKVILSDDPRCDLAAKKAHIKCEILPKAQKQILAEYNIMSGHYKQELINLLDW